MISRRQFFARGLGVVIVPLVAEAQPLAGISRIGFLSVAPHSSITERTEALREGLRALGYVEGRSIVIEWRFADETRNRLPGLAAELVNLKVAVIVTGDSASTVAVEQVTKTLPIVMATSADPVGFGLVASLARPGGNVTGFTTVSIDLYGKQVGLLKELVPTLSRVAILSNPTNTGNTPALRETETAARALGLQLQIVEVREAKDLDRAFSAMIKERVDAVVVATGALFLSNRTQIAVLAAKNRLPAIYGIQENVEAGGLIAYAANRVELFRRAASYVDKILRGAKPADLPVEQATKFDLIINLRVAKALGLKIPQSLLLRADEVIQ